MVRKLPSELTDRKENEEGKKKGEILFFFHKVTVRRQKFSGIIKSEKKKRKGKMKIASLIEIE